MTLRVATFNVLASAYADWPARRRVIAAGLTRLRPDVVALQEVIIAPELAEVEQLLGPGWYLASHTRTGPDGVGAVLASRWPLSNVRHADLELQYTRSAIPVVRHHRRPRHGAVAVRPGAVRPPQTGLPVGFRVRTRTSSGARRRIRRRARRSHRPPRRRAR
ncbi:endonuclease/exonuclease/phosphatase family protein [Nocardia brasiliensis]|nr:endonuclease/exonuclease/phosphatase family protein [Nocardia brasiliensis]